MGERPFAGVGAAVAVRLIEDAGIVQVAVGAGKMRIKLGSFEAVEMIDQRPPRRPHASVRAHQLVRRASMRTVVCGKILLGSSRLSLCLHYLTPQRPTAFKGAMRLSSLDLGGSDRGPSNVTVDPVASVRQRARPSRQPLRGAPN